MNFLLLNLDSFLWISSLLISSKLMKMSSSVFSHCLIILSYLISKKYKNGMQTRKLISFIYSKGLCMRFFHFTEFRKCILYMYQSVTLRQLWKCFFSCLLFIEQLEANDEWSNTWPIDTPGTDHLHRWARSKTTIGLLKYLAVIKSLGCLPLTINNTSWFFFFHVIAI